MASDMGSQLPLEAAGFLLAERSEAGALTAEEQAEFDGCLHIGNLLAFMQSKARLALKKKPQDRLPS